VTLSGANSVRKKQVNKNYHQTISMTSTTLYFPALSCWGVSYLLANN
jgi:hypothetical protein